MELMQTLDNAWNSQVLDSFEKRHRPDVVVRWPGKPPTYGVEAHAQEARDFFRAFPDQHLDNRPYRVFFASGDWTCSIAHFTGTMSGPMTGPDGKEIPPTGKPFEWTSARSRAGMMTGRSSRRTFSTTWFRL